MQFGLIFFDTLRQAWRQVLYWGGGLGLLALYIFIAVPDMNALQQYANLIQSMPPSLLEAFGMGDVELFATPDGFIVYGIFGYGILIMAVYAVMAGMSVVTNDEDEGILDMVLSLPLPRWRLIVEKTLAYFVIAVAIALVLLLALWLGKNISSPEIRAQVHLEIMAQSTINLLPPVALMLSATVFCGVLFRRKSTALAVVTAFIVASYFLDFIGGLAGEAAADVLRALSFFAYFNPEGVLRHGLQLGNMAVLLGSAVVLFFAAIWFFQRRDIASA